MKKMTSFWRRYIKLRNLFIPDGPLGDRARGKLYEPFLAGYGENFKVAAQAFIFNPNGLTVGRHVYIGFGSYLGQGEIQLDDEVLLGNFVSITASNHLRKGNSYRFGGFEGKKVHICKGSWLAAHSSIMAGVTMGECSLAAAGSVVTKDVEKFAIVGGIPAQVIKMTEPA